MEISITWGCIHAILTVTAFLWQYLKIINCWYYVEFHKQVYWPLALLLISPGVVIYQMISLNKPFQEALDHYLEQFLLYSLALSSAWMIGRYKLICSGKWDIRISFVEKLERLINARQDFANKDNSDC